MIEPTTFSYPNIYMRVIYMKNTFEIKQTSHIGTHTHTSSHPV